MIVSEVLYILSFYFILFVILNIIVAFIFYIKYQSSMIPSPNIFYYKKF